ncbi:IS3 family transposase [Escherichia coli]|uniref:IS3 family transposase n=1 Tax=Escherichia coli TaxID=562 RepID=UPI00098BA0BA
MTWVGSIFFHSLKVECIHGELFISWETIWATVFSVYNRWRRHSGCGALVLNNLKTRTSLRAVHITWVRSPLLTMSGRKETELI